MPGTSVQFVRRLAGSFIPAVGVQPDTIWVRHERFGGWEFAFEFSDEADVIGAHVRVQPSQISASWPPPPQPMTTRFMRSIPWAELEVAARSHLRVARTIDEHDAGAEVSFMNSEGVEIARQPDLDGGGPGSPLHQEAATRRAAAENAPISGRRPGPVAATDSELLDVAAAYVRALADEVTQRSPVKAVAAGLVVSTSTARGKIAECRKRGLLTPTIQGRPGGDLTPRAVALLQQQEH